MTKRQSRRNEGLIGKEFDTVQTSWRPQLPLPKEIIQTKSTEMDRQRNKSSSSLSGLNQKKWSLGRFFRKKNKDIESDISSDDDRKAGFYPSQQNQDSQQQQRNNKKDKKQRCSNLIGTGFDHIVNSKENEFFIPFQQIDLPTPPPQQIRLTNSLDGRAARREQKKIAGLELSANQNHSSTDEKLTSMRSSIRYRSDDSLGSNGVANGSSSSSRKSRAARNERYFKRLNRDGEISGSTPMIQITQQVGRWKTQPIMAQQPLPLSIFNGQIQNNSTNSFHYPQHKNNLPSSQSEYYLKNSSNTGKSSYPTNKFVRDQHSLDYRTPNPKNLQNTVVPEKRSVSFDNYIHLQEKPNVSLPHASPSPPVPPPRRDPQRRLSVGSIQKELRPISYAFDQNIKPVNTMNGRCVSDDRLWGPKNSIYQNISAQKRPSSTQPQFVFNIQPSQRRFITRAERETHTNQNNISQIANDFQYVTDATPRSRKPIHSFNSGEPLPHSKQQTANTNGKQKNKSPIRTTKTGISGPSPLKLATDFWKQIDQQENNRRGKEFTENRDRKTKKSRSLSSSHVNDIKNYNNQFNGDLLRNEKLNNNELNNILSGSLTIKPTTSREKVGHYSEITKNPYITYNNKSKSIPNYYTNKNYQMRDNNFNAPSFNKYDEFIKQHSISRNDSKKVPPEPPKRNISIVNSKEILQKNPTNLEDAINELEDIYKSLKLSDDSLMDRAEHDIPSTINFEKYARNFEDNNDDNSDESVEPDIVLDDVAYRNAKHANEMIKTIKSQQFGIPIGPIPPSPNTDYLHVTPDKDKKNKISYSAHNYPDLVSDDLAVRSLRKDCPGSKPISIYPNDSMKKKRATRTQSANIYTLIQRDAAKPCGGNLLNYFDIEKMFDKAGSLTDISKKPDDAPVTLQLLKNLKNDPITPARKQIFRHPSQGGAIYNLSTNLIPDDDNINNKQPIPLPRSSDTPKSLSGVEEFLNQIAKEAKESSQKLERDLIELRKETAMCSKKKEKGEQNLIEIENVSRAAKRCEEILLGVVPPEENIDLAPPRKLKSEGKLLKDIDETSEAANSVRQKLMNENVTTEPSVTLHEAIVGINYEVPNLKIQMKKDSNGPFVVADLIQKLDPSSKEIGKIASRCMRQISELGDLKDEIVTDDFPDYDNLNGNIDNSNKTNSNDFMACKNTKKTKSDYRNIVDNENPLILLEDDVAEDKTNSSREKDNIDKIMKECQDRVSSRKNSNFLNLLYQSSEESARGSVGPAALTGSCHSTEGGLDRIDGIVINTPYSSSSDCIKSSSLTPNRHQSSSITSINNAFSSSDYIKSPSSEINPPSTDQIKTFSTTSYEVHSSCSSAAATPNLINLSSAFSESTTPSPSINLTPIGNEVFNSTENIYQNNKFNNLKKDLCDNNNNPSQYDSSEELAMIFGITRSSSPIPESQVIAPDK